MTSTHIGFTTRIESKSGVLNYMIRGKEYIYTSKYTIKLGIWVGFVNKKRRGHEMEFIIENYQLIALILMVADKVVAMTPNPYDDMIITAIKGAFKTLKKKKVAE